MKNCGKPVHEEVIKRSFLEEQKERIQGQLPEKISHKLLDMIQTWGLAGKSRAEFALAADMYNVMKGSRHFLIENLKKPGFKNFCLC